MTYEQVFEKFQGKYPTMVVEDYRPFSQVPYTLLIWEKGKDYAHVVRYKPDEDEFIFVSGSIFKPVVMQGKQVEK